MSNVDASTLFDHLAAHDELITYRDAFTALFGAPPTWRHAHTQQVVKAALGTSPRKIAGLHVRLDALIVDKEKRRPSERHFLGKDYSERDWLSKFAARNVCGHSVRAIRSNTDPPKGEVAR